MGTVISNGSVPIIIGQSDTVDIEGKLILQSVSLLQIFSNKTENQYNKLDVGNTTLLGGTLLIIFTSAPTNSPTHLSIVKGPNITG